MANCREDYTNRVLFLFGNEEILETWGYNHRIEENTVSYSHPTLHHGDYETMLVRVRILPAEQAGPVPFAQFTLEYVDMESPVTGFSDAAVLKSGTMLHFAQPI
jgi:hypothetical protein